MTHPRRRTLLLIAALAASPIAHAQPPEPPPAEPPANDPVVDSEPGAEIEAEAEAEVEIDADETPEQGDTPDTNPPEEGVIGPAAQDEDPQTADDDRPLQEDVGVDATPPAPEDDEVSELVPQGEEDLADNHDVDATGITFVPGKGLRVTSADGRFRLETRARVQIAWEGTGADGEDWGQQVRLRRARLQLAGHMFSEDVRFKFELAVSPNDIGMRNNIDPSGTVATRSPLLDFYVDFRHLRDLQFRVGQYKIPSNRQRVISSGNLQLVDRSIFNGEFTLDRDVGFDIRSGNFLGLDMFRYYLGMYIARGHSARGVDDFGMLYLSRVEFLPFGMFVDYSEADFQRTGPRLSIGVNYSHIDRARRNRGILGSVPTDGGFTDTHHIFADAIFKWAGFSSIVEFGWRHGDRIPGGAVDEMGNLIPVEDPRNGWGGNVQAGYLIPHLPIEVAGRYSFLRGLGTTNLGDANELTGGVSYYPGRHPYKVQLDYSRLWADSIDDGGHRVRLQLQVAL